MAQGQFRVNRGKKIEFCSPPKGRWPIYISIPWQTASEVLTFIWTLTLTIETGCQHAANLQSRGQLLISISFRFFNSSFTSIFFIFPLFLFFGYQHLLSVSEWELTKFAPDHEIWPQTSAWSIYQRDEFFFLSYRPEGSDSMVRYRWKVPEKNK